MTLFNPYSGAGRAARAAEELRATLEGAGHEVERVETSLDPQKSWLDAAMERVDLAIVVGGDGAVRLASGAAGRTKTPIYHYPLGTENLFARAFEKKRNPGQLLEAIDRFETIELDLGIANGRKFLIMATLGFDADVVHALAAKRTGGISHLSYAGPILSQLLKGRPPTLTVEVDGRTMINGRPGWLVVANSPHYALRTNPAWRASMTDGRLDVVFFPARSSLRTLFHMAGCRLGLQRRSGRTAYAHGAEVRVKAEPRRRYQLDGDPPERHADDDPTTDDSSPDLFIHVRPSFVPVLLP
jgi:diacylglycerol kinase (ATP)